MSEENRNSGQRKRRSSKYDSPSSFPPEQHFQNTPYINGEPSEGRQYYQPQPAYSEPAPQIPKQSGGKPSAKKTASSKKSAGSRKSPPIQPVPMSGNQPGRKPDGIKPGNIMKILIAIGAVALAVLLILGISRQMKRASQAKQLTDYVNTFNNVYCQNVYVDGIHLGGMTQQQALDAVNSQIQEKKDSWHLTLTFEGKEIITLTAEHLGLSVDIAGVMQEAWAQGHTGTVTQRNNAMESLLVTPYNGYTSLPQGNLDVLDPTLLDIQAHLTSQPQDAYLEAFDPSLSDPFIFQSEVPGKSIDIDQVRSDLTAMIGSMQSGTYDIVPVLTTASVTVEMLRKNVTLRGTATTPISTSSTTERTNNIRRSFEMISGTIIAPGNSFNFNNIVGRRTSENGFYPAIEYAYGGERMGIGGGVCQASTTVYLAALKAGLQIDKRRPHSAAVSYTDYGLDATVSWEGSRKIDLNFTNNTEGNIYIVAKVESDPTRKKRLITRVSIYGIDLGNISYDVTSQLISEIDPPSEPNYVKDKNHDYVTYTDEQYQYTKPKKGYIYDSYRITYENGTEIYRDFLYRDEYPARQEVIYVGTELR